MNAPTDSPVNPPTPRALTVRHRPWPSPAHDAGMPLPEDAAHGLAVTDRAILRDGAGWIPVSGEVHYSRLPRRRWGERLRQMRASGITAASTYVFWLHHVPERGAPRFDGDLDIGAFVDECADAGLDLVLRIGPWAHGEARNGGFPEWVQEQRITHRSDDPRYLALVREWFAQLAGALDGRARPGGPVIAIQLENELYDRPEHLRTLKRLAREAGITAPLWTATAWGGAALPHGEVFPLFSGYADGFWLDPEQPWDDTFRAHFLPSHDWDDPGVGADVRALQGDAGSVTGTAQTPVPLDLHGFPPATCELGSGMATAYHRRPVLDPRDIAALAHTKIGNGSAWQGYYMFAGGRNPGPGMQESQSTGYPNDLPEWSYDFHAPISQAGELGGAAGLLRAQHAFLRAFGDRLAGMTSALPDEMPRGVRDRDRLRWALRSDGTEGFAVISHHQPYEGLDAVRDVHLRIELDAHPLLVPSAPIDIPSGTLARWPIGLRVGGTRVRWATASVLTLLPGAHPTLVLVADAGIPVELALDDEAPVVVTPGDAPLAAAGMSGADVLVLPADAAEHLWVQERAGGGRRLLRTAAELAWDDRSVRVRARAGAPETVEVAAYDPATRSWAPLIVETDAGARAPVAVGVILSRAASGVPADHGFGGRRHRAPDEAAFSAAAAVFVLDVPDGATDPAADAVLEIDWAGDVGQLRVDGVTVDDRFWDGTRWRVSVTDAGITRESVVTLHVLPLSPRSSIALPRAAAAVREAAATGTDLLAVTAVTASPRGRWRSVAEAV